VPLTAVGSTFDRATLTARSATSPTISDTAVFTTIAMDNYAERLEPPTASRLDNPAKTVTYTLTIYNDGNITDTYDLTKTLTGWTTTLSTDTVGPGAPWSNGSFEVYVTIPGGAANGAQDAVTVTASSQGSLLSDYSILTTVATTQTVTRGVEIAPPTAAKSGSAGSAVVYHLTVTNTGSITDSITMSAAGNTWPPAVSPASLSLPGGASTPVTVTATIPSTASGGQSDAVTITAQATGVSDSSILTTTAAACQNVETVTLGITNTGTIYTDTLVYFSADIAPDNAAKSYTYTINYGSGAGTPTPSSADPLRFTHTFAITGIHTITVSAWNCTMATAKSDSMTVTVSAHGKFIYLPLVLKVYP
jgi:hypothetical protein